MHRRVRPLMFAALVCASGVGLAGKDKPTASKGASPAISPDVAAAVAAAMKPSVDPCTDFYTYACGGWLETTELPPEKPIMVRGFTTIDDRNEDLLHRLLDDNAKAPGEDADHVKLANYWTSCMDEAAIDALGARPVQPVWEQIAAASDLPSIVKVAASMGAQGADPFFNTFIGADNNNPDVDILHVFQGGLALPDRTYYLDQSNEGQTLLRDYEKHIATMLMLGGLTSDAAATQAKVILAFETKLAEVSWPTEKVYDAEATNNKIDLAGLQKLTPHVDWTAYFAALGSTGHTQINVGTPSFFEGFDKVVAETPVADLQAVLRWWAMHAAAPALSHEIVDADFAFFGTELSGAKALRPRWKRCVAATDGALGDALGKLYVASAFPGDSKEIAVDLISRVEGAFSGGLPQLAWMDDVTRGKAIEKLDAITNKVGYPEKWRDYSKMSIQPGQYYANRAASIRFEVDRQLGKWEQPVDRTEWGMTPPTVNAYYNANANEIAFPAGILQPPFFDRGFPMAMNFGAIGMVMGHEITHGFDDDGRKFDKTGRMTPWWAPEVEGKFVERTKCVGEQYSKYEVQPGLFINGELTMGENIADLGGVKESYRAFRQWESEHGRQPEIAGLSADQQFFVAYAQGWCALVRPELEKQRLLSDSHSPPRFRVNGPLADLPEFATAFKCAEGTPMNPVNKCEVW